MIIYLDFDGTVVEHAYPKIGRENFGCLPIIKKLMDAGHKVILNTYRSNIDPLDTIQALYFINFHPKTELPYAISASSEKIHPLPWDWNEHKRLNTMFIDDIAPNIPLKSAVMEQNKMVDWDELDKQFHKEEMYKTILPNNTNEQE